MIRRITKKFVEYISENKCSNTEKEEMEYVLNTIIFETLKFALTFIIFAIIGYPIQTLLVLICMALTKPYIGGYHEETQVKCFIATLLLTAGIIFMSIQTKFTFYGNVFAIVFCIFCIYNQIPVINPNMPITRPHLIQKNRKHGLCNTVLLGIASIVLYKYCSFYSIITWEIIIQTLLLFNKKENKRGDT